MPTDGIRCIPSISGLQFSMQVRYLLLSIHKFAVTLSRQQPCMHGFSASRMSLIYLHKNLHSCSSEQPGVLYSFMNVNYVKQSKSPNYIVCGSSKPLLSVFLSKNRGWLLSCFHCSCRLRCFCEEQGSSPCPKQLHVPTPIIASNFLDVLDMSSNVSDQHLPLSNNLKTHIALLFCLILHNFSPQFSRS